MQTDLECPSIVLDWSPLQYVETLDSVQLYAERITTAGRSIIPSHESLYLETKLEHLSEWQCQEIDMTWSYIG